MAVKQCKDVRRRNALVGENKGPTPLEREEVALVWHIFWCCM
jgi:hypothetical protein